MAFFTALINLAAPLFLMLSPITSYIDQILSMHRTHSSRGFSLDIPLIMLTSSLLKIFYWPGARFDYSLLIQALVMLVVQSILLKVALAGRNGGWRSDGLAIRGIKRGGTSGVAGIGGSYDPPESAGWMPFGFWRWRGERLYWQYVLLLFLALGTLHVLLAPSPESPGVYTTILGALGLTIEATLPLPQMYANYLSQSCKGFRLSVLANWIFGDAMKMGFFFLSADDKVPWAFKVCGCFQAACDLFLGVQYWMYGEGKPVDGGRGIHLA